MPIAKEDGGKGSLHSFIIYVFFPLLYIAVMCNLDYSILSILIYYSFIHSLEVPVYPEDIEISQHLNRKGSEKGIRPVIVKFVSHKVKTQFYKSKAKLKDVRVSYLLPSCSVATRTGGRIFINESLTSSRREVIKGKPNAERQFDKQLPDIGAGKFLSKTSPNGKPVRIYEEGDLYNYKICEALR